MSKQLPIGFSGCQISWGWVVLTWGPFSVMIGLAMAADVALVVLNGVIISNRGWWERWGNLPGLVDDSGGGWQWWRGWAVCRMQWERDGCVGGSKVVTWQHWN